MTRRSQIQIAVAIGTLFFAWLSAAQVAPFVSAAPGVQATLAPTATPAPPTPPTSSTEPQNYVIETGDTLWSIATKFYGNGSKYTLIQRANNLPDNAILQVGATLVIPPSSEALPTATPKASSTPSPIPSLPSSARPTTTSNNPVVATLIPATSTPAGAPAPPSTAAPPSSSTSSSVLSIAGLVINALSVLCLLGSVACAFLSIDSYRRSKRYVQRDYIRKRIRVKA